MHMSDSNFQFHPIGIIHSCFKEKFGVPRQSSLAPSAVACLELLPPYDQPEGVQGLAQVSHLWLQFVFHLSPSPKSLKVRPPRLGGNQKVGVFATRSPVRPNRLGLSVVRLVKIEQTAGKIKLWLAGADLVDGTPVLDIKPYVPYVDAVADATNALAPEAPRQIPVHIPEALGLAEPLHSLVREVLSQDPRPAYQHIDPARVYGMHLLDFNLQWRYQVDGSIQVLALSPVQQGK